MVTAAIDKLKKKWQKSQKKKERKKKSNCKWVYISTMAF